MVSSLELLFRSCCHPLWFVNGHAYATGEEVVHEALLLLQQFSEYLAFR